MNDREFLNWIYLRLINKHGENPTHDFMRRMKQITKQMPKVILNQKGEKSPQDLEKE